ncbi:MAG: hypothetical protein GX792_02425 [Bacteroidales bacterium]|nr:hypothetical protein [Bacteroidales bacterium]
MAKAQFNNGLHKPSAKEDGNKATTLLNLSSFIAVHFLPVRQAGSERIKEILW